MKHLPYEDWLISETPLTTKEYKTLHDHLCECDACYGLSNRVKQLDTLLASAPILGPAPGFSNRWQARLAQDLEEKKRLHRGYIITTSVMSASIFLLLIIKFFLGFTEFSRGLLAWIVETPEVAVLVSNYLPNQGVLTLDASHLLPPIAMMAFFAVTGAAAITWLKMMRLFAQSQGIRVNV